MGRFLGVSAISYLILKRILYADFLKVNSFAGTKMPSEKVVQRNRQKLK